MLQSQSSLLCDQSLGFEIKARETLMLQNTSEHHEEAAWAMWYWNPDGSGVNPQVIHEPQGTISWLCSSFRTFHISFQQPS